MPTINCPKCSQSLKLPDSAPGGQVFQCPACQTRIVTAIPFQPPVVPPTALLSEPPKGFSREAGLLLALVALVAGLLVGGLSGFLIGRGRSAAKDATIAERKEPPVMGEKEGIGSSGERAIRTTFQDDTIPKPKTDPTHEGVPASSWAVLLKDKDSETSSRAMAALVRIGGESVPHVEPIYRNGTVVERASASAVLVGLVKFQNSQEALDALVRALRSPNALTRMFALQHLGQCGPAAKGAIPWIKKALNDPDSRVKVLAAEVLPKIETH